MKQDIRHLWRVARCLWVNSPDRILARGCVYPENAPKALRRVAETADRRIKKRDLALGARGLGGAPPGLLGLEPAALRREREAGGVRREQRGERPVLALSPALPDPKFRSLGARPLRKS